MVEAAETGRAWRMAHCREREVRRHIGDVDNRKRRSLDAGTVCALYFCEQGRSACGVLRKRT